uniref:Uncharacterized protein n=1 Tax=Leptocylindrus danicus TaxID=163516 RepID=A0A7S2K8X8_9STRA|mmetsp:Transcript_19101/g.28437  ORF Transcript_19101/g.28437 Transcript_19101/m.28437 type:complete len:803 (+) Transcript_19101:68-2476(+)
MVGTSKRGVRGPRSNALRKERNSALSSLKNKSSSSSRTAVPPVQEDTNSNSRCTDPLLLARGMTSRVLGARIPELEPLSVEEIQKDLTTIETYNAACVQYTQQLYIYRNRLQGVSRENVQQPSTVSLKNQSGAAAQVTSSMAQTSSMSTPSRAGKTNKDKQRPRSASKVDPEEEKRQNSLRKKISLSEAKREVLESQYVSLRAHYVHQCQSLEASQKHSSIVLKLLQGMAKRKANVLALKRARICLARDIVAHLQKQQTATEPSSSQDRSAIATQDVYSMEEEAPQTQMDCCTEKDADASTNEQLLEIWNALELQLKKAESACNEAAKMDAPTLVQKLLQEEGEQSMHKNSTVKNGSNSTNNKPKTRGDTNNTSTTAASCSESNANKNDQSIRWDSIFNPNTPRGRPLLISPLSRAPDRIAAVSYGKLYNSDKNDLMWLNNNNNLPRSFYSYHQANPNEVSLLKSLKEEVSELDRAMEQTKRDNAEMNAELQQRRKQSNAICSQMAVLRTETEAVLMRHSVILETPEARARADEAMAAEELEEEDNENDNENEEETDKQKEMNDDDKNNDNYHEESSSSSCTNDNDPSNVEDDDEDDGTQATEDEVLSNNSSENEQEAENKVQMQSGSSSTSEDPPSFPSSKNKNNNSNTTETQEAAAADNEAILGILQMKRAADNGTTKQTTTMVRDASNDNHDDNNHTSDVSDTDVDLDVGEGDDDEDSLDGEEDDNDDDDDADADVGTKLTANRGRTATTTTTRIQVRLSRSIVPPDVMTTSSCSLNNDDDFNKHKHKHNNKHTCTILQ